MPGRRPSIKHAKPLYRARTTLLESGLYRRIMTDVEKRRVQATDEDAMMAWKKTWEKAWKKLREEDEGKKAVGKRGGKK